MLSLNSFLVLLVWRSTQADACSSGATREPAGVPVVILPLPSLLVSLRYAGLVLPGT